MQDLVVILKIEQSFPFFKRNTNSAISELWISCLNLNNPVFPQLQILHSIRLLSLLHSIRVVIKKWGDVIAAAFECRRRHLDSQLLRYFPLHRTTLGIRIDLIWSFGTDYKSRITDTVSSINLQQLLWYQLLLRRALHKVCLIKDKIGDEKCGRIMLLKTQEKPRGDLVWLSHQGGNV